MGTSNHFTTLTAAALLTGMTATAGHAASLRDPPVFASTHGSLDLVMVAGPVPTALTSAISTTAWVYEVCARTAPTQNACPAGSQHPLGGVRLQLNPGDTLKIRLVNNLPPIPDAKHVADIPTLIGNPTNLHTHGLIVEPHRAEGPSDPYGDYVFVELRNPANPIPDTAAMAAMPGMTGIAGHAMGHPDVDVAYGAIDYAIQIPSNHPSGLFWFHPHIHGVALNQVSAGLSGIITVGADTDGCADAACRSTVQAGNVRHIVLKDMQILAGGTLQTQENPGFCGNPPTGSPQGACPGVAGGDVDYTGGSWVHTVNGQVFPTIDVPRSGDVWRIVNSSGSRSYSLWVGDDATYAPVLMQVLSIDGVTIDSLALSAPGQGVMAQLLAGKVKPVRCPGVGGEGGLCTANLRLMPSARAEVRIVGPQAGSATLKTELYFTGGDSWPAIDLAAVTFAPGSGHLPPLALGNQGPNALGPNGALMGPAELRPRGAMTLVNIDSARASAALPVTGSAMHGRLVQASSIAIDPALKLGLRTTPECAPLQPGHRRRILFGDPTPGIDGFGLGYVEVDERGREIEATRKAMGSFDPISTTVCLPLGPGGAAVKEIWELYNLTAEDHNFHIHQTRFRLLRGGTVPGTIIPASTADGLVLHDNVPVPRADDTTGCDGSVEAFKAGLCRPHPVVVEIPFHQIGDFVYHCHILEHEDGGMMARIRVVAPRA